MLISSITLACAALFAQNGATEISRTDHYNYYNDIWGYTAPNGDEYAIIGTKGGTAFYDVSVPSAPSLTGYISGPASTWRDMKTLGDYCYVVTEGGGGMQIIDLTNPHNPTLLSTWGSSLFSHAHNVAIDEANAMAYILDADPGTIVVDLSNPTSPQHVATYSAHDVHDAHIQNGKAHFAEIHDGNYRIVDVTNLPNFSTLDAVNTPGDFTHNVWVNASDTIAVTTDENDRGGLTFYDISNPNNIQYLSRFDNKNARVHNAFIKGDRVYASWYTFGFACIDFSDPAYPQQVASYDTSSKTGFGFDGAWGVYPYAQSGLIYLSDQDNGLIIIDVDDADISLNGAAAVSAGATTTLTFSNAEPNVPWYLLVGFSNAGHTQAGTTIELGAGFSIFATGNTGNAGTNSKTFAVPPTASGRAAYFEVVTLGAGIKSSNLFRLSVL
ncbi:MAG: choice-of-anchor B family protein [Planctomycetes bacterium]|nr:choice-of-anchor B family protein [Planctomycetota bacterium]